jgi:hypothetical protein
MIRVGFLGWLAELTLPPPGADVELEQPAARVTAATAIAVRAVRDVRSLRFLERAERAPIDASAVCRSTASSTTDISVR